MARFEIEKFRLLFRKLNRDFQIEAWNIQSKTRRNSRLLFSKIIKNKALYYYKVKIYCI